MASQKKPSKVSGSSGSEDMDISPRKGSSDSNVSMDPVSPTNNPGPSLSSNPPSKYWDLPPRPRERSLSRTVAVPPYNPAEHYMDTEWIAPKASFLQHLEEGEIPDDADLKRWKEEIVQSEAALNDLAAPKGRPDCSRGMEAAMWEYDGKLHTTDQDLRPAMPLPKHQFRKFRYEHQLVEPEHWDTMHERSHIKAKTYHLRTHDRVRTKLSTLIIYYMICA